MKSKKEREREKERRDGDWQGGQKKIRKGRRQKKKKMASEMYSAWFVTKKKNYKLAPAHNSPAAINGDNLRCFASRFVDQYRWPGTGATTYD